MLATHQPLRYAHDEGHTDVCYFEDGKKFVTCGADGDIRIWSTDESEDPVHNCVGEWALAVRQKGDKLYVATSSNDVQILSLPEGDRDGVLDRFIAPINHIAVAKNSQLIALAGEDMEVKVKNLEPGNKEVTVFDGMTGPCLSVAICPNSSLLGVVAGDGKLRVWNIEDKSLVKEIQCFPKVNSFANATLLYRIDFDSLKGKQLAYPKENTVILLNVDSWSEEATLHCDEVTAAYSIVQYSPCGKYILATSEKGDFVIWNLASEVVVSTSKHEKSAAICGLMWNPQGNGQIAYTDVEGQLGIITEAIGVNASEELESKQTDDELNNLDFESAQFEDDDEDNENAVSVEKLKRQIMGSPEPELEKLTNTSSRASTPRPRTPVVPLQAHFMPSSTPEHLDPRYLCWNEVGVIRCYGNNAEDELASKSIEVEFHDTTFHNSMMMQNYQDYTMGSLSKAVLAVANSSQINIIPLSASSKEWTLKMEETEEIILVATSENLVCFGMSNYIVRVCSVYGTQRGVVSIPGPLVAMAAYKNVLMVAYHEAGVRDGDQCINVKLVKFEGTSIDSRSICAALGPKSTLSWLGFSDVGTPTMMDSLGMLSLYPHSCSTWIPYCDISKHHKCPGDKFFVTAVFESYQAVGGIKCKGTVYPGFTPRPTICEIPLEPVFAETSTEKTQMEMNLFTWSTLQISDVDKKVKETALKLFALACRNNLDERALELMEILASSQLVALGLKYASKLDRRRLVEKLMDLATKIADENEEDLGVKEMSMNTTLTPAAIKPVYRKLTLSAAKKTPKNRLVQNKEESTPNTSNTTQNSENSTDSTPLTDGSNLNTTNTPIVDTQESLLSSEERPNPFLKSAKKPKVDNVANPLSLTDRFAGVSYEKENENKAKKSEQTGEKRKLPSDVEKPKEKQRKLDSFKFTRKF